MEKKGLLFTQVRAFGDETAMWDITGYKAQTVGEFVQEALQYKPLWSGYIYTPFGQYEYRGDRLLDALPEEEKGLRLAYVTGYGGWNRMDYLLRCTEKPAAPTIKRDA